MGDLVFFKAEKQRCWFAVVCGLKLASRRNLTKFRNVGITHPEVSSKPGATRESSALFGSDAGLSVGPSLEVDGRRHTSCWGYTLCRTILRSAPTGLVTVTKTRVCVLTCVRCPSSDPWSYATTYCARDVGCEVADEPALYVPYLLFGEGLPLGGEPQQRAVGALVLYGRAV